MPRVKISEFGVVQKLLAGATVQILSANDSGESTGNLATLYEAATGSGVVSNPQTLDEDGRLSIDCYVDGIVVAEISNISDLAERTIKKLRANPVEFPLGATNANYQGVSVIGLVDDAEGYANQAESYLNLMEDTFQGIPSTTSLSIGSGSKTFAVAAGLPLGVGQYIIATSNANPTTHSMNGQVTAYSGTSLTITVDAFLGSGSRADWTIRNSGPRGATGATGPAGAGSGDMLKSENLSGLSNYTTARSNLGLGTAATATATSFATAAQGAKADTALQPSDITDIGAFVLLETYTPSASSSVDITSILSATYDDYMIIVSDLAPSVDNSPLILRTSVDDGTNWDSAGASYAHGSGYANSTGGGMSNDGSTSDTSIKIANAVGNASQEDVSCVIHALNVNSTTKYKKFTWTGCVTTATGTFYSVMGSGRRISTAAINALQLKFTSGNITGTIKIYGIKK